MAYRSCLVHGLSAKQACAQAAARALTLLDGHAAACMFAKVWPSMHGACSSACGSQRGCR